MKKFLAILLLSLIVCEPNIGNIMEEVIRKMREGLEKSPAYKFLQKLVANGIYKQFEDKYNSMGKKPAIGLCMKLIEKVPEGMNEYPTVENLCSELIRLIEFLRGIY